MGICKLGVCTKGFQLGGCIFEKLLNLELYKGWLYTQDDVKMGCCRCENCTKGLYKRGLQKRGVVKCVGSV